MHRTLSLALAAALGLATPASAETVLRVLSFNVWGGGLNDGSGPEATLAAIRAAAPDIIGLQEVTAEPDPCTPEDCRATGPSVAEDLAASLGYHVHRQVTESPALWANAILSRHPIVAVSPGDLGVAVDLDGRRVWLFNIHLDDEPYQPYQLLGIEYGPAPFVTTAAEAITWAEQTRGPAMDLLAADMAVAEGADLVLVTGDFNEPSHLDWTAAAATAGLHPLAVDWPASRRLADLGFTDLYRARHPDPVARPAFTWTPWGDEADPEDHHDRIDFAYGRAPGLVVRDAWILGEAGPRSDLAVDPWPADHRAVLAEIAF
ncbi:MAG: endonuclease/exonuclease/phosphatase family protein [Paracoccaceae bacterium]|nr:MAG: endonuclease/exonuclease/phosphatase family protein [Paracoccaceae bacterium]